MKRFSAGTAFALLLGLASPLLADPVDDRLAAIRKTLAAGGCREAGFRQTYVPAGMGAGRAQAGSIVLSPPERIRFEYDEPKGRAFAVDGATVTAVDPASRTVSRRELTAGERARYPLFDLVVGRRPPGFRVSLVTKGGETRLEAVPVEPTDELTWGGVTLGKDGKSVVRVEWTDSDGNRNRFDLGDLRPRKECSPTLFRPAVPEGWKLEADER